MSGKLCKCGCGIPIPFGSTWAKGHNRRGEKHSKAALQKMREARLGNTPWNKGKPRTEEEKEAMRRGISTEERERRSKRTTRGWKEGRYDFMNGKTNPACRPEVATKIGEANKGRIISKATRHKLSKSRLGKPGQVVSERVKKLHSKRMKKDNPMYHKDVLQNHPVLRGGRYYISIGENKVAGLLTEMGIAFERQKLLRKQVGYYVADFFLTGHDAIIEFDGHYSHVENAEKDRQRDCYLLRRYGYRTLRLVSMDLNNRNREDLIQKIREFLWNSNQ